MHKQLMTVMLLTRGELTGYQTFDSFWVVVFWSGALVLWDVLVEVGEFLAEILSIRNSFNFVIFGILFIKVVVLQIVDSYEALQNWIHVAVQTTVL